MEVQNETRQDAEFHGPNVSGQPGSQAKPGVQARQGVATGRILAILIIGVILVMAGFAVSYVGAI